MAVWIGQFIGFLVIVGLLVKFVVPPVRRLMANQQDAVRNQLAESDKAKKKLEEAKSAHQKALDDAKAEAKAVIEEARADSKRIAEQLRAQADAEVERIKVQGERQIELLRAQLIRQLRQDLGIESVRRAGDLVREHVADADAQSATVDRFLDELDRMAPSEGVVRRPFAEKLRVVSRESVIVLNGRFDDIAADLDADGLAKLDEDLVAVARLLGRESFLTRHLSDSSSPEDARTRLADSLLNGKIGDPALDIVKAAVSARWSSESDLVAAVEHVARLALLKRADLEDQSDEVEDQLFRFSRILDGQPQLTTLLSEYTRPVEGRVKLVDDILSQASGANPIAAALIRQTVQLLRGQRADEAVSSLVELAVSRRGEVVARVVAAAPLTDAQHTRLVEVLSRIYNHPVSVQLSINPKQLGGLAIAVGDEVIDGTLASRLAAAENKLPD